MRVAKQPITAIAREAVSEVDAEAILEDMEGHIPEFVPIVVRAEDVAVTPTFRVMEEIVSEEEETPTPPREVEEAANEIIQQGTTPRRVKTCARKRRGAEVNPV